MVCSMHTIYKPCVMQVFEGLVLSLKSALMLKSHQLQVEHFRPWIEAVDQVSKHASAVTIVLSHSNINFSTTMLKLLFQVGNSCEAKACSRTDMLTCTHE